MAPAQEGSQTGGMQTSVPYAAIPFLAILGAVAMLLIFWAFARLLGEPEPIQMHFTDEQAQYMREVRQKNRQDIADLFNPRRQHQYYYPQQLQQEQRYSRGSSQ